MYIAKTKALISFAVIAKLICVFVFAYVKCWFSHDAAHFICRCCVDIRHLRIMLRCGVAKILKSK